ncbi:MAG: hypothetical protein IKZ96_00945 [Bacilli bacterium]|nr:hypothetical protein [Bacilli bacterium]
MKKSENKSTTKTKAKAVKVEKTEEVKEEVVEKVKVEKVKTKKEFKITNKHKIIAGCVLGAVIILCLCLFLFRSKVDTITRVKKIASAKYYSVECLNTECDYIVAAKGDKLGKIKVDIFNASGNKVAKFKDKYYSKNTYLLDVSDVSKNYIIFKKVGKTTNNVEGYTIANTKGKAKYSTGNKLTKINNNLISEVDTKDNMYYILTSKGKVIYDGVSSINVFASGKIVALSIRGNNILINENGENILNGYTVSKDVVNANGETLYLVVSDSKGNGYYYFDINSNKIIGQSFNGYTASENEGELIITRKDNNSTSKYILSANGKQVKMEDETVSERVSDIKEKLGSDYALYVSSVIKADQRYVFVNKIKDSSFGIYDVNSGKYTKLYNYSSDSKSTTIYDLESKGDTVYMQAECYQGYCDKDTLYVYDLTNNKELFKSVGETGVQKYAEYTNGYKVIRYSNNAENEKYQGKYVLFDKKNKELLVSPNIIIPVGEDNIFGEVVSSKALILYSTKDKKALNNDNYLGSKINVKSSYVYKFSDKDNTYLYSSTGKKLVSIKTSDAKMIYSDETIIYILNGKVNIVDPTTGKTKKYRLKGEERINDLSGDTIPPYRNSLYVNNTAKDYVKVVNVRGKTVKKIKGVEIKEVTKNDKTNNVIIIVRKLEKNNNTFGLYIAK